MIGLLLAAIPAVLLTRPGPGSQGNCVGTTPGRMTAREGMRGSPGGLMAS